jgi:hypothetical protein
VTFRQPAACGIDSTDQDLQAVIDFFFNRRPATRICRHASNGSTRSGAGAHILPVGSQREERIACVVERAKFRTRAPSSR